MRKVCVRLIGGIGNQMFQIAAAIGVAGRVGGKYCANASGWFGRAPEDHPRLVSPRRFPALHIGGRPHPYTYMQERGSAYRDIPIPESGHIVMCGYWQSPRYWAGCEAQVRAAFPVYPIDGYEDTCAINYRGGDYLAPDKCGIHRVCRLGYYERALALARAAGFARFIVVTDDPEQGEAVEIARMADAFITGDPCGFDVIASCGGVIGTNSTYGWWATWLGASRFRVFPNRWFVRGVSEEPDILPDDWARIEP